MLTRSRFGVLHVNFSKFPTQLLPLAIVKVSFRFNILPVKEITLHVKPVPIMYFMHGGVGEVSNKHCLLTFLVLPILHIYCTFITLMTGPL